MPRKSAVNLSLWNREHTIPQNAQNLGIRIPYAYLLAHKNGLPFVRAKGHYTKKKKSFQVPMPDWPLLAGCSLESAMSWEGCD